MLQHVLTSTPCLAMWRSFRQSYAVRRFEQRFISIVHQAQRSVAHWENTMFKNLAMASAGLAFIAAPVAASAAPTNPASTLSVAKSVRAGSASSKKSQLGAGGVGLVPLLIGAGIVAGATYLIIDKENDDSDSN